MVYTIIENNSFLEFSLFENICYENRFNIIYIHYNIKQLCSSHTFIGIVVHTHFFS